MQFDLWCHSLNLRSMMSLPKHPDVRCWSGARTIAFRVCETEKGCEPEVVFFSELKFKGFKWSVLFSKTWIIVGRKTAPDILVWCVCLAIVFLHRSIGKVRSGLMIRWSDGKFTPEISSPHPRFFHIFDWLVTASHGHHGPFFSNPSTRGS